MEQYLITPDDVITKVNDTIKKIGADTLEQYAIICAIDNLKRGWQSEGDMATAEGHSLCVDEINITKIYKVSGLEFVELSKVDIETIWDWYDYCELPNILIPAYETAVSVVRPEEFYSVDDPDPKTLIRVSNFLTKHSDVIYHQLGLGLCKKEMLRLFCLGNL